MQIRQATLDDVAALVQLERHHGRDELLNDNPWLEAEPMDAEHFTGLIAGQLVVVAEHQTELIGYGIVASRAFYAGQPFYRRLFGRLDACLGGGSPTQMACYGPVWVAPGFRGKGVFGPLVDKLLSLGSSRYRAVLTFIAEENQHSLDAHVRRAAMEVVDFFDDEGRGFYLLYRRL